MKATTGKKPAALKGRLTSNTFGQFLENGTVGGDSSLSGDIRTLATPAIISTLFLSSRITALGLMWESVFGGFQSSSMKHPMMDMAKLSLASPVRPTMKLIARPAGRLHLAGGTPWYENVFDTLAVLFETGGLVLSWPPSHMNAEHMQWADIFRWGIWFLDLTNDAAVVITRAIGGVADIARHLTKWRRGVITMFTTIPKFVMELVLVINDYVVRSETVPALVRHIVETILGLAADIGFIVAAGTDHIKGAEEFFWSGFGVFLSCTGVKVGLKIADYALEDDKAER